MVCLFPTRRESEQLNIKMLQQLNSDPVCIKCVDTIDAHMGSRQETGVVEWRLKSDRRS